MDCARRAHDFRVVHKWAIAGSWRSIFRMRPRLIDLADSSSATEASGRHAQRTEDAFPHEVFPRLPTNLFEDGSNDNIVRIGIVISARRVGRFDQGEKSGGMSLLRERSDP